MLELCLKVCLFYMIYKNIVLSRNMSVCLDACVHLVCLVNVSGRAAAARTCESELCSAEPISSRHSRHVAQSVACCAVSFSHIPSSMTWYSHV